MKIYYPPVGIAHITSNLSDLFIDRIKDVNRVRIACITQPKTDPHFGTMMTLLCCFSIAKKISRDYKISTEVLIDSLENSPAEEIVINDVPFTRCLSHKFADGKSLAEVNTKPIIDIAKWISDKSRIPFYMRSYKEIQSQRIFREGLKKIIKNDSIFLPIFNPSGNILKIRPLCIKCGLVDKNAQTVYVDNKCHPKVVSFICPNHGVVNVKIDDINEIIDCNTPIRTVLRSYCFSKEKTTSKIETIVVNGRDWAGAWMQRVYFDGLINLGCSALEIPFNLFTPLVLDETGAKLSKTIYLEKEAYLDIDNVWLSSTSFLKRYGERGMQILWDEVESWIESPQKFFRNYSHNYFKYLIDSK